MSTGWGRGCIVDDDEDEDKDEDKDRQESANKSERVGMPVPSAVTKKAPAYFEPLAVPDTACCRCKFVDVRLEFSLEGR
jgi:hypothetical protein